MKISKKILMASLIIGGLCTTTAFANTKSNVFNGIKVSPNLTLFMAQAGQINCYQHNTDICINNKSGQKVYFTVPKLNSNLAPLANGTWADAYSNQNYSQLKTLVFNKNYKNIFNQTVPNHSIVEIDPSLTATSQPIVRVIQQIN